MITAELSTKPDAPALDDELFRLELRVAQCADRLVSRGKVGRGRDLKIWSQAEREVLGIEPAKSSARRR